MNFKYFYQNLAIPFICKNSKTNTAFLPPVFRIGIMGGMPHISLQSVPQKRVCYFGENTEWGNGSVGNW